MSGVKKAKASKGKANNVPELPSELGSKKAKKEVERKSSPLAREEPLVESMQKVTESVTSLFSATLDVKEDTEVKMEKLEENLGSRMEDVENQVNSFEGKLETMKTRIDNLESGEEKTKKKFQEQEEERDTLRREVTEAITKTDEVKSSESHLQATIGKLSKMLESIKEEVNGIDTALTELVEEVYGKGEDNE